MNPLLEPSPVASDEGILVGRDPRKLTADEIRDAGLMIRGAQKAIRAHCIECSGGNMAEARKCTATRCNLWLWRMGSIPNNLRAAFRDAPDDGDDAGE